MKKSVIDIVRTKELGVFAVFTLFMMVLFGVTTTVIDINSKQDLRGDNILKDKGLELQLRKNEFEYRENLISKLSAFKNETNFTLLDSISQNPIDRKNLRRYILIEKFKSDGINSKYITKYDERSYSPLIKFKEIITDYEIDYEKLENIINSSSYESLTEDFLKFGNYLNTSYTFHKELNKTNLIIYVFILVVLITFLIFLVKKEKGIDKNIVEEINDNISNNKADLEEAKKILEDDSISTKEMKKLKKLLNELEQNIDKVNINDIMESILFKETINSKKKSSDLYRRSNFMLTVGLLVAVVGIVLFYFSLPEYSNEIESNKYLVRTIRPTLVLIFIQSISFYLLKQYRTSINDYKYFYNEHTKKANTFSAYQLSKNENINDMNKKIIYSLTNSDKNEILGDTDAIVDTSVIIETIKSLIDKL